jgi:flavodoxin
MKKSTLLVFCAIFFASSVWAQNDKILIAYFSWSGNTKEVAEQITAETGGTLFEIKTAEPYSQNYSAVARRAKAEHDSSTRPPLAGKVNNMAQYGTIYLGFAVWYHDMPMAVYTFLESYDFSNKTIIPFGTESSGGFVQGVKGIKKECQNSAILEGFEGKGWNGSKRDKADVTAWLKKIHTITGE